MNRKPQFSLAGLLVLMLVAAMCVGWLANVWRREQQAKKKAQQRFRGASAKWMQRIEEVVP